MLTGRDTIYYFALMVILEETAYKIWAIDLMLWIHNDPDNPHSAYEN